MQMIFCLSILYHKLKHLTVTRSHSHNIIRNILSSCTFLCRHYKGPYYGTGIERANRIFYRAVLANHTGVTSPSPLYPLWEVTPSVVFLRNFSAWTISEKYHTELGGRLLTASFATNRRKAMLTFDPSPSQDRTVTRRARLRSYHRPKA